MTTGVAVSTERVKWVEEEEKNAPYSHDNYRATD